MYEHLDETTNRKPGLSELAWFAPVSEFDTIAGTTAAPANPGDTVIIPTDHTFTTPASMGFRRMRSSQNVNKISLKSTGQVGSMTFDASFTGFIPGSDAALHETLKNLLNTPVIILSKDADCDNGKVSQLGTECSPAYLKEVEYTSGTVDGSERKGYALTFQAYQDSNRQYDGVITELP